MTLEFLCPDLAGSDDVAAPLARSALEPCLRAAGARFGVRHGWSVATSFGSVDAELAACCERVGVADRSPLGKLELQAPAELLPVVIREASGVAAPGLGTAARAAGTWWCPVTAERALALSPAAQSRTVRERLERAGEAKGAGVVDLTTALGALAVVGPRARDLLARLTALDLRPRSLPETGFRPGSVARTPAMLLRERGDRFLLLFGAAYAEYVWTVVTDAGEPLGSALVGEDALDRLDSTREVGARA